MTESTSTSASTPTSIPTANSAAPSAQTAPPSPFEFVRREIPKNDWSRAWSAIKILVKDSERTDQVFVLLDALGGPTDEASYREFAADPRGISQLTIKPDLLAALSDHESLAALPEGSLGRVYLEFMTEAGLNAKDLIEAEAAGTEAQADFDPGRRWLADRGRDSHDLWHVLTRYGRDEGGEAGLLAFTYANYSNPGIAVILLATLLIVPKSPTFKFERYLWQAYRRGKAANLEFAPYEEWLTLPIDEARRRAGILPPEVAHPGIGIIVTDRMYGTGIADIKLAN